jgi:hypothetical protein
MRKTYTKKELVDELGIKDTTLRETLKACGFDTKRQEYPADEIDQILKPARELLAGGEITTLREMSEWAKKKRQELYGDDDGGDDEEARDVDHIFEEMVLEETEKRLFRALQRRIDMIPVLYEDTVRQLRSEGQFAAAFDAFEERKQERFREEMRKMTSRKRQGLPYYEDDDVVIDARADVIDDGATDEDFDISP